MSTSHPSGRRRGRTGPKFRRDDHGACGFTYDYTPGQPRANIRSLMHILAGMSSTAVKLIVCGVLATPYMYGNSAFAAECLLCAPQVVNRRDMQDFLLTVLQTGTRAGVYPSARESQIQAEMSALTGYDWAEVLTVYVEEL